MVYLIDLEAVAPTAMAMGAGGAPPRAYACCACGRRRRPALRVRPRGLAAPRPAPVPMGAGRRRPAPHQSRAVRGGWGWLAPMRSPLLLRLAPPFALLLLFNFFILNCRRFKWKAGWNWWRTIPGAVIELDADEFNFGAMLTEQASTGIP